MTHLVDKNAPERGGNGRIRRTLPALGLIAAAISGYNAQSGDAARIAAPERVALVVTPPMIAQEATLLHFARAQGVGDALRETTGPLPGPLTDSLFAASAIVEAGRTDLTAYRIDMAYSAGYLEAVQGGWTPERLDAYLNAAFLTEIALLELADQATLRWARTFGLEGGRALVTGAMALTVASDPFEPIWSGPLSAGPERATALVEVSSAARGLLDALEEAAGPAPLALPTVTVTATTGGRASAESAVAPAQPKQPEMEI